MQLLLHLLRHLALHFGLLHARGGSLGEAVLLPWEIFLAVWLVASFRSRRTVASETIPQRWQYLAPGLLGFVLVFLPETPWGWGVLAARMYPDTLTAYVAGAALAWIGILFTVWARACLGSFWSGRISVKEGHQLVQRGPYRFVRHPIYTGLLVAMLGTGIALGELRAAPGVAAVLLMYAIKLRREEAMLAPHFGAAYAAYRQRTPALFPGLGGWPAARQHPVATPPQYP